MPHIRRDPTFEVPSLDIILISGEPHIRALDALAWLDISGQTDGSVLGTLDQLRAKGKITTDLWSCESAPLMPGEPNIIPYVTLTQLGPLAEHLSPGATHANWDLNLRQALRSHASIAGLEDQILQFLDVEPCTRTVVLRRFAATPREYLFQALENLTRRGKILDESIRLGQRGPATSMYRLPPNP